MSIRAGPFVDDVMLEVGAATKLTFTLAHPVAAAIVIPTLCSVTPMKRTMNG